MESIVKRRFRSELRAIDWDFEGCSHNGEFAAVHWYPARFIPEIPGTLIGYFTEPGQLVLDPFCGTGATLTEAMRLRRPALGIDVNPVATLIARARTAVAPTRSLREQRDELVRRVTTALGGPDRGTPPSPLLGRQPPDPEELRKWFHPDALRQLTLIVEHLRAWPASCAFRVVATACFSAILHRVSSQNEHWGYVCDNMKPKSLVKHDAHKAFVERLERFIDLRAKFLELCDGSWLWQKANRPVIATGRAQDVLTEYPFASVDAVVTSPPYLNVTDYSDSQRLTFLWWPDADRDRARQGESGARWKRFRATSLDDYMRDMGECLAEIARVLKPGRYAVFVLGESGSHPNYIDAFIQEANESGLSHVETLDRRISRLRTLAPSLGNEHIVLFQRGRD